MIRYHDLRRNEYMRYFKGHQAALNTLCISPKNDVFMSASLVGGRLHWWVGGCGCCCTGGCAAAAASALVGVLLLLLLHWWVCGCCCCCTGGWAAAAALVGGLLLLHWWVGCCCSCCCTGGCAEQAAPANCHALLLILPCPTTAIVVPYCYWMPRPSAVPYCCALLLLTSRFSTATALQHALAYGLVASDFMKL